MPLDRNEPVYAIGIVAHLLGVHQQTLRNYERWELVVPKRSDGGNRLYSDRDIERIGQILQWKEQFGVNLAGVELMTKLLGRIEELEQQVNRLTIELVKARNGNRSLPG